jgi:cytoskeletal protein RodZ
MNRNVAIVTLILVVVVIAGYLVWLRSKYQQPVTTGSEQVTQVSPSPSETASPSASPKEATGPGKLKTSTPSSTRR